MTSAVSRRLSNARPPIAISLRLKMSPVQIINERQHARMTSDTIGSSAYAISRLMKIGATSAALSYEG